MKSAFSLLLLLFVLFSSLEGMNAQVFLKKLRKETIAIQKSEIYEKKNFPVAYNLVSFHENDFKTSLNKKVKNNKRLLQLPNSNGGFSNFTIKKTSNFETELSEKFSMIKSYVAQGIDDPTAVAKISIGTDGFHAVVFSRKEKTLYIDPYSKDNETLIVYKKSDLTSNKDSFICQTEEFLRRSSTQETVVENANDGNLRTFRLALACSGEYAQFHLTHQNVLPTATDIVKKAAVLSAMNTTITRVNGIFERDIAIKMVLVGNNDKIIFLDATTDGITDGNPNRMIGEAQTICDATIGNANYDIGHLFSIGGDGIASLNVVCENDRKARGVTGISQPIGDAFDISFVTHEMGHQFGANHTQNNPCNRYSSTAVEPGSASTVMGYAGICSPNIQSENDAYFHTVSITEIWNTIQTSANCARLTATNNTAPTANAGADFSIPKETPFVLKGIATDADGTASLTYNWEQIDNEIARMPPSSTNAGGPMFRSLPSKLNPTRYMPELATVVAGNTATRWEVLPSIERDLNFSFLVRDNHSGGGRTARDVMKISVENAETFTVTAPNSPVLWGVSSTQTITWAKGTTNIAPINCQNVTIKLSIDCGLTFPIILKENTPNDGVENIVIPNNATTFARIMVAAADNIFYNVNSTNFTITAEDLVTSKEDFEDFNLYPNPTKGEITLHLKLENIEELSVQLLDTRGRLISEKKYYNTGKDFYKKLFFNKASVGLYLLKITNGNKQIIRKLLIE